MRRHLYTCYRCHKRFFWLKSLQSHATKTGHQRRKVTG